MSFLIKRTTNSQNGEIVRYFMRATAMGPMFQTIDLARHFDTYEDAVSVIEGEYLRDFPGEIEVVEIV